MTDMATGCDVPEGVPWKGAHMRNRKLRNIRPSGAFWPEMTSSNVTNRPSPGTGSHVSALGVLSRTSASYLSFSSPFTGYLALSHHKGSAFNNYTTKVCCFRICSVLLQVVYHVRVLTVGVLNNLRVKWMKCYIWLPNRRSPGHEILGPKWVSFFAFLLYFQRSFNVLFINCSFLLY
jgi:hypothetical protein